MGGHNVVRIVDVDKSAHPHVVSKTAGCASQYGFGARLKDGCKPRGLR